MQNIPVRTPQGEAIRKALLPAKGDCTSNYADVEKAIMNKMIDKPDFVTEEHLEYLDDLRESGVTNMFGAAPYLMAAFPELSKQEAQKVLMYWMESFSTRHGKEE